MAVYTEVTDDDLSAFLARYDVGSLVAYKGIAEGVENTNYLVQTTNGRFILTLYEKRVAPEDLPFFLGLMEHVAERGVSCPRPVHAKDGTILSELAGRTAAMVTFLDGFSVKKPRADHCLKLGRALAQFHLAAADFPLKRTNALGETGWQPLFEKFSSRADEIVPGLQAPPGRSNCPPASFMPTFSPTTFSFWAMAFPALSIFTSPATTRSPTT
jgi:homoserine kinase type II